MKQCGIVTVQNLADMPLPLTWKPDRGSADTYGRVREQARIQVEARETGEARYELLPVENGFGLTRLSEPTGGDIFFDLEGDPFVGEHGLEYLFGYAFSDENGQPTYRHEWAFTRAAEKQAFENFVDFVIARREEYPGLHIYHYAPYEPAALKRLMGRYATRQEEIDHMLRAGLFVDLFQIVRRGLRASVESYSIKLLDPFYDYKRETALADANAALASLQADLELDNIPSITEETKAAVLAYNRDDCNSARGLRNWLEKLRAGLVAEGTAVPRLEPGDGAPNEKITDWLIKINALIERLTAGILPVPKSVTKNNRGMEIKSAFLTFTRKAVGAGVIPDVRAIAPEAAELNIVEVRFLAVSEHEHKFMPGPVKRAHAAIALNPNTQV